VPTSISHLLCKTHFLSPQPMIKSQEWKSGGTCGSCSSLWRTRIGKSARMPGCQILCMAQLNLHMGTRRSLIKSTRCNATLAMMRFFSYAATCGLLLSPGAAAFAISPDTQRPIGIENVQHTIRELDDRVCKANTRQWSGNVHVSAEKSLFYCE